MAWGGRPGAMAQSLLHGHFRVLQRENTIRSLQLSVQWIQARERLQVSESYSSCQMNRERKANHYSYLYVYSWQGTFHYYLYIISIPQIRYFTGGHVKKVVSRDGDLLQYSTQDGLGWLGTQLSSGIEPGKGFFQHIQNIAKIGHKETPSSYNSVAIT